VKFSEIIDQATALLQRKGRLSYRALKREFELDDEVLEDVKEELLFSNPQIEEIDGRGLVWTGTTTEQENPVEAESDGAKLTAPADATPKITNLEAKGADSHSANGERRQLTVMFCDLVDSTALSGQLDPEDLRNVVRAYQDTAGAVITRYEGHIAQYLGDGLLVYFGHPVAHEDDARRAVLAGLEIIEEMAALNERQQREQGVRLALRLGIHTGVVVLGEMGGGERHGHLALGDTPNIAARLEGLAAPDTIVISGATARLVQGTFALEALGPQILKGVSEPMTAMRVLQPHAVANEGQQNHQDAQHHKGRRQNPPCV
jgi:class 3 adenylate cyclase